MDNMSYNRSGGAKMPDYEEMYFHMARKVEKAVRILAEAQRQCEEMYINSSMAEITMLPVEKR